MNKNNQEIFFDDLNEIQNQEYKIIDLNNKDNFFIFNPYDYIFNNIDVYKIKEFQDIVKIFNNPKNFSLYKIYKNKQLFNDQNLFESFQENIKCMLKSNVINQLYNQLENFKLYTNPYHGSKKDKFIEQTFQIILYMPIPFYNISGFTYKNFGIIILDSKEILKRNYLPNTYFLKSICDVSFKKVVSIHEIIFKYISSIIHGNEISYKIRTPENSLIDHRSIEKKEKLFLINEVGDLGESLLFGNKIKYIFIKGGLYLLNNENFEKDLAEFSSQFIELNEPDNYKKDEINVQEEINKNSIISFIKGKSEDIDDIIKITNSNSYHCFRNIYPENTDDEQIFEDGVLYCNRLTHRDITFKERKIYK